MKQTKRWDKKEKCQKSLSMPCVIDDYNKHMCGVDLLDFFVASFCFKMRSRRLYIYLFWHFISIALSNAWNIYRREYKVLGFSKTDMLSRRHFQVNRSC